MLALFEHHCQFYHHLTTKFNLSLHWALDRFGYKIVPLRKLSPFLCTEILLMNWNVYIVFLYITSRMMMMMMVIYICQYWNIYI